MICEKCGAKMKRVFKRGAPQGNTPRSAAFVKATGGYMHQCPACRFMAKGK